EPRVPLETNGPDAGGVPDGGGVGELRNTAIADCEQRDGAAGDSRGAVQSGVLGATGAQAGAGFGRRADARSRGSAGESRAWSGRRVDGADSRMSVGSIANAGSCGATARTGWRRGAAGGIGRSAQPRSCGGLGEGAGGAGW